MSHNAATQSPGPAPSSLSLADLFDAAAFDAALGAGEPAIKLFRETLKACDETFGAHFHAGVPATVLTPLRAELVDALLRRAWAHCGFHAQDPAALLAVGGYGRGELHPGSDIDLLVLVDTDPERLRERLEAFIVFLWDIGLEVGSSVRSLDECEAVAADDITIATNLMEARRLAGPEAICQAMAVRCGPRKVWPGPAFFEAKRAEQQARHRKFDDTAYRLEPNIKEGPGGLRDIQMIGWVAKRHFGTATLHGLVDEGFLTEGEYHSLVEGQGTLWQIRWALHLLTGRREDRLLFDYQPTLAEQFGYRGTSHNLAVEQLMQRYYRTVMELARLNEMLLQLFQETILGGGQNAEVRPINRRFQARGDFLEVTSGEVFRRYPFALMELFLVMAQHPELKGVRASTIRLVRDHRHRIGATFRADLRNRALFMELLRQPQGITHELRRMNRYGVLARYLPSFGRIVGQMQYDLFHAYTVDEHTLMVVRNLRRFFVDRHAHELPACWRIAQQLAKPELLYLAGLFHDIAKGRGGDHSELGASDAEAFCEAHGLSRFDTRLVAWLVRSHLAMSRTAQREDIDDPAVIARFAALVGDTLHLDYLYLLTVADIRGTNPDLWNGWKDALLIELYSATLRALRRGLGQPPDQSERVDAVKAEALAVLRSHGVAREGIKRLWQDLEPEYFLRHTADEVAHHTRAIVGRIGSGGPLVLVRQRTRRGGTEVFVYAEDGHGLFALTTSTLGQLGLDIQDARIITSAAGFTMDSYTVLEDDGEPISSPERLEEIRVALAMRLADPDRTATPISRRPSRQARAFPVDTEVGFSCDEPNRRSVMEVITADRPGLLSRIGQALADCDIRLQNAKIATYGAQVDDFFFITDPAGRPLDEAQQASLRERVLAELE